MEHDLLKELVEASVRKLPYQRNHIREDLDFEIIPMDQSRNVVVNNSRLFISVSDFFEKTNAYTRLSREAESQCAVKIRNGNTTAREQLFDDTFRKLLRI